MSRANLLMALLMACSVPFQDAGCHGMTDRDAYICYLPLIGQGLEIQGDGFSGATTIKKIQGHAQ